MEAITIFNIGKTIYFYGPWLNHGELLVITRGYIQILHLLKRELKLLWKSHVDVFVRQNCAPQNGSMHHFEFEISISKYLQLYLPVAKAQFH